MSCINCKTVDHFIIMTQTSTYTLLGPISFPKKRGKVYPKPEMKTCKTNINKARHGNVLSKLEHDILEKYLKHHLYLTSLPITYNIIHKVFCDLISLTLQQLSLFTCIIINTNRYWVILKISNYVYQWLTSSIQLWN